MKPTVTRSVCIVALVAAVGSAVAGGRDEGDPRVPRGAGVDRPSTRAPDPRGSGHPGTAVFHGLDGMVIRFTVPGAAVVPVRPAPADASSTAPPPNPPAAVGGGFVPEQ